MANRVIVQRKYARRKGNGHDFERYEVLQSRRLYQAQFEEKTSLKRQIKYLEKCEKTEKRVFESNKKMFIQKMKERFAQANKARHLLSIETHKLFPETQALPNRQSIILPKISKWSKVNEDLPKIIDLLKTTRPYIRYGGSDSDGEETDSSDSGTGTSTAGYHRRQRLGTDRARGAHRKYQWPVALALATSLGAYMNKSATVAQVTQLSKQRNKHTVNRAAQNPHIVSASRQYVRLPSDTGDTCVVYGSSDADDSGTEDEIAGLVNRDTHPDTSPVDSWVHTGRREDTDIWVHTRQWDDIERRSSNTEIENTKNALHETDVRAIDSRPDIRHGTKDTSCKIGSHIDRGLITEASAAHGQCVRSSSQQGSKPTTCATGVTLANPRETTDNENTTITGIQRRGKTLPDMTGTTLPEIATKQTDVDNKRHSKKQAKLRSGNPTKTTDPVSNTPGTGPAPARIIDINVVTRDGRLILTDEEYGHYLTGFRHATLVRLNREKAKCRFLCRKVRQFRTPSRLLLRDETVLESPLRVHRNWDYSNDTNG